jgi:hypothetical protein
MFTLKTEQDWMLANIKKDSILQYTHCDGSSFTWKATGEFEQECPPHAFNGHSNPDHSRYVVELSPVLILINPKTKNPVRGKMGLPRKYCSWRLCSIDGNPSRANG